MTLESWSMGIVRPMIEAHPRAWAFVVPSIVVATSTMQELGTAGCERHSQAMPEVEASLERPEAEIRVLRVRLAESEVER